MICRHRVSLTLHIIFCSCEGLVDNLLIMNVRQFYGQKKFTSVLAGREDAENDDEFLDDSVLSKFKVFGFCRLRARVF